MVQERLFLLAKKIAQDSPNTKIVFLLTHKVIFLKNDIKVIMLQTILLLI